MHTKKDRKEQNSKQQMLDQAFPNLWLCNFTEYFSFKPSHFQAFTANV